MAEATRTSTTSSPPHTPGFHLSLARRREMWEAKYALVRAWFDEHRRLPGKAKNKVLHNWLHYQRRSWPSDPGRAARLCALGVKPFCPRTSKELTSPSSRAEGEMEQELLWDALPGRSVRQGGGTATWGAKLRELERFRAGADGQNPPYTDAIGRWLYEQIALRNQGLLSSAQESRLEGLGIKWGWKDEVARSPARRPRSGRKTETTPKRRKNARERRGQRRDAK